MHLLRRIGLALAVALGAVRPAGAQVAADTSRAAADTTAPPRPAAPPFRPLPPAAPAPGDAIGRGLPMLTPLGEPVPILEELPGSFRYTLGSPGWPEGWSPYGLAPRRVGLEVDGRPFDDLLTGRPRFDLLPVELIEPLRLEPAVRGAPLAVHARLRDFEASEPVTEIRYRAGGGLQAVSVTHVQERRRSLFGAPGLLNVLANYGGDGSGTVYAGTVPLRERRLYGRIRYAQAAWSVELSDLQSRTRIGAHGDVRPRGDVPFWYVYYPQAVDVEQAGARHRTVRNDLALTLRAPAFAAEPLTLSAWWTAQLFRYASEDTALTAAADRFGLLFRQPLPDLVAGHRLLLRADAWLDRLHPDSALYGDGHARPRFHAALRDSARLAGMGVVLEGGFVADGARLLPSVELAASGRLAGFRPFAEGIYTGRAPSWIERHGFGAFASAPEEPPGERLLQLRAGLEAARGPLEALLFLFARRIEGGLELYAGDGQAAEFSAAEGADRTLGLSGRVRWRQAAGRGLYGSLSPTLLVVRSGGEPPGEERLAQSLPRFFADGRLGARYRLFDGNLNVDFFLRGRFWTRFRSRKLHAPTGLFALPAADARAFGPAGALDAYLEAGIRGATVFLAYENALAGTFYPGTLLVPVHPLPARRLRFGVFWPITG